MNQFSDFIIYADESGDHSLSTINEEFPVFVLAFCVFRKVEYTEQVVPTFQQLKFKTFGHDMIVLHERDIVKAQGPFAFLTDPNRRSAFMETLTTLIEKAPFEIVAVVLDKRLLAKQASAEKLYPLALRLALEPLDLLIRSQDQHAMPTHIVFEARGKKEDIELEHEFRRICDGDNHRGERLNLQIVIAKPRSSRKPEFRLTYFFILKG